MMEKKQRGIGLGPGKTRRLNPVMKVSQTEQLVPAPGELWEDRNHEETSEHWKRP